MIYFVCRMLVCIQKETVFSYLNFQESDGKELKGGINLNVQILFSFWKLQRENKTTSK